MKYFFHLNNFCEFTPFSSENFAKCQKRECFRQSSLEKFEYLSLFQTSLQVTHQNIAVFTIVLVFLIANNIALTEGTCILNRNDVFTHQDALFEVV